jgi:hypothetical protein
VTFKKGDLVRCIERTESAAHLRWIYEVVHACDEFVTLQDDAGQYRASRFELADWAHRARPNSGE